MVDVLSEWVDPPQRLVPPGKIPVLPQSSLMFLRPVGDEPCRSRREFAGDDGQGLDVNRRFVIGVTGVEVRSAEVVDLIVVHPDHDSVERTDPGHRRIARGGSPSIFA
jgi:hypothetical protein